MYPKPYSIYLRGTIALGFEIAFALLTSAANSSQQISNEHPHHGASNGDENGK